MSAEKCIRLPQWAGGYVYLLETSDRFQKVGFSGDPWMRVDQFQNLPFCVWLSHCFPVVSRAIEILIHKSLAHKRVRGEWFILTPGDIKAFCRIRQARTPSDLPLIFRHPADSPHRPHARPSPRVPGRPCKAWYRKGRNQWYSKINNVMYPLGVYGEENQAAADRILAELLAELKPEAAADVPEPVIQTEDIGHS